MSEITKVLIRILPFLVIIIVLNSRIKQKKISTSELAIQKPDSLKKYFIWCFSYLLYRNGILEIKKQSFNLIPSIIRIIGMVIIAPIAEELIYRGLFLNKLIGLKINKHIAIFILALIFVGVHSFAFENTLSSKIGIAQTFIDASLFSYARFSTKSIYTPITMHMTGNLIATLEIFLL